MKKILGFDSWTVGAHNYARLNTEFSAKGYELILIHIGSWGHDTDRASEEIIDGLKVRDISYYKGKSIPDIYRLENAHGVVFLSTRSVAHQAANLYALNLNIPTLHLYHGLVSVQSHGTTKVKSYKRSIKGTLVQLYLRFWKNFTLLIPTLIVAFIKCKVPLSYWKSFFRDICLKVFNPYATVTSLATKTTLGCIYTNADREHMMKTYAMKDEDIYDVGNPDLISFGLTKDDLGSNLRIDKEEINNEIIYIDTGLVQAGFVFGSYKEYFDHLILTQKELQKLGYSLCFKPHPDHYHNGNLLSLLSSTQVRICTNLDFKESLRNCSAVIAEPSTAALIPALMAKPLFLVKYGKMADQQYGEVLKSYPFVTLLTDFSIFKGLNFKSDQSSMEFKLWSEKNSGPLPASLMPQRVVNALMKYL